MAYFGFAIAFFTIIVVATTRIGKLFSLKNCIIIALCIVLGIICNWAAHLQLNDNLVETKETARYELVTLQDDSQLSGNLGRGVFYVYGSINTEEVYNFYYKTQDGGFVKGKVNANKAVIYENDECSPVVVEYTTYTRSSMNPKLQKWLFFYEREEQTKSYKIYVPKGTVANEYSLDAK